MSAVFYSKYKNLFFDEKDPEPLSMNYFVSKPKNSININPSQNIASLAQHYNILPKDLEIPRHKVEEISTMPLKPQSFAARLDPLPYKPPLPAFETRPKQPALEYSPEPVMYSESPKRANSIQKLPPIPQDNFRYNENSKVQQEVVRAPQEGYQREVAKEVDKFRDKSFENKKQGYEQTKGNIFPDKVEAPKVINSYQEALKNRKEAKGRVMERRQRLKDLLSVDGVLGERKY